jgi:hypothetical protein
MNAFSRLKRSLFVISMAVIVATCIHDVPLAPDGPPHVPWLTVSLETPHADDGALIVTLRGAVASTDLAASSSYHTYPQRIAQHHCRILVVGDLQSGALFRVRVSDGTPVNQYAVEINEVATRASMPRDDLAGYRLTLEMKP